MTGACSAWHYSANLADMKYLTSFHGIQEVLRAQASHVRLLVATGPGAAKLGPRARGILETAEKLRIPVEKLDQKKLDDIDPDNKGIALLVEDECSEKSVSLEDFLQKMPACACVLILDHIEDPQNLGAIIRSADAFGVNLVIIPKRRASPLTEAAVRASAGATAWVPVASVQNLADAVEKLQKAGFWVYASDMKGTPLASIAFPEKTCFILGNEGDGVSRLLLDKADETIAIPMRGHVDSLNVSVAAAICMYEFTAKRGVQSKAQ